MKFTEIENYLTQPERTVTGVKFETSDEPLVNKDLVDVPESDNWLNLTAITWGFGDDMIFSLTQADGRKYLTSVNQYSDQLHSELIAHMSNPRRLNIVLN